MNKKSIFLNCKKCDVEFQKETKFVRKNCYTCSPEKSSEQKITYNKSKVKKSHELYTNENSYEWVECRICQYRAKDLWTHYSFVHACIDHDFPLKSQKLCDAVKGDKNPWANHGGRLSPFSDKFVKYQDENGKENKEIFFEKMSGIQKQKSPRRKESWIEKGYTEENAIKKVSEVQSVFSLEKCIQKHGETEGARIWQDRQDRWQETLNSKSDEELTEINKRKIAKGFTISKGEKLLHKVLNEKFDKKINNQKLIRVNNKKYFYDIEFNQKIIEYNGDMWHANPVLYSANMIVPRSGKKTAQEIWNKDKYKIDLAKSHGYDVLVVWESEFKNNKEYIVQKCINFLNGNENAI